VVADAEVEMSPDPAAGTAVAGYRIVERVGSGGMGVVWRAEETGLGDRPVALKLLPPALAGDPDFRARFLREMRVAAAIDHPNIVPIYRAGEDRGLLYLAMRYVHASDLRRVLEAEGWTPPTPGGWSTGTSSRATSCSRPQSSTATPSTSTWSTSGWPAPTATTARSAAPGRSSARPGTPPPNRPPGSRSTAEPTATPSAASSSSA
jgi:Protein kinase domain